jgi:hypothetical protein
MLLITSGEYVETELFAEFGRIPPAFLPVGNKRLYTYQIAQLAPHYADIWLTIPLDFELDEADRRYLVKHRVHVFRTAPGIPLGRAICAFLQATDHAGTVDVLYGDTLIGDERFDGTDWLAVGDSDENYHWHHEVPKNGQPGGTWTGMFSFSDARKLCRQLESENDFIAAVTSYGNEVGHMAHKVVRKWLDFGHIHTYFDSKREITTQRHFNQLRVADGVLTKSSTDTRKMQAEADWFEQAPAQIRPFLPNFIARNDAPAGYQLEYLHLAALNELFVFGRLPERVWKKIFSACDAFLQTASRVPLPAPLPDDLAQSTYLVKTQERLAQFGHQTGISLEAPWTLNGVATPSLQAMAAQAADAVLTHADAASFIHGDFCFSNILFDFRAGRLKIIDPRGIDCRGMPTPYGDLRYDIGKLAHSVLGLYDFIIAGFFSLSIRGQAVSFTVFADRAAPVKALFAQTEFLGRRPASWDCYPVMLLLFLSMLPLHVDNPDRQHALMANCLKIYLEWKNDHHTDGGAEQPLP